ncbi:hypothetical protein JTB14_006498 [Gonioctena quinquepunctata]|nr:hypothetical protein JTB14_006498 [Gonioctena quinquepunctata]
MNKVQRRNRRSPAMLQYSLSTYQKKIEPYCCGHKIPQEGKLATKITKVERIRWATKKFHPYTFSGSDDPTTERTKCARTTSMQYTQSMFGLEIFTNWQISDQTPKPYRTISPTFFLIKNLEKYACEGRNT